MELSPPPSPAHPSWRRARFPASVVALGLYAVFLATHMGAVPGGADSSGYFNHARLLGLGTVHAAPRELPGLPAARAPAYLYTPLGLKPALDGRGLVSAYPPGFPLLILAASHCVGWSHSADLVMGVHSILGLLLTWALARALGLTRVWSAVAVGIVASSPLYLSQSLQAMSDVPSAAWVAAAVLAAWRARGRAGWALAAGAGFGFAILIRPTNALALAPLSVALAWPGGAPGSRLRRTSWFALGGLPCAVFFCLHSEAAYGHFFMTGYGTLGPDFAWKWAGPTLARYAVWLPVLFTPAVVFAVALPKVARSAPCEATLLALWIASYAALYCFYRFTHEAWWYLRFLLPCAPALVIGGLLGLRSVLPAAFRGVPHRPAAALALGAVALWSAILSPRLHATEVARQENVYPRTTRWLQANLPPRAVILCFQVSGAVYFDTDFCLLRWDAIDSGSRQGILAAIRSSSRPLYAALFRFETEPALRHHMPGRWTRVGAVDQATIWRWDGN